ncbi:MAG TPA: glycoside hydrolase family 3 C-terminal domain-containing protein [Candidatus Mediterraneibacter cottocaccae]|nr:glycoside hydrolase family 3 C-terminal domain-containing protein [Candidatus Mediterraneibacter cottocaccae]
MRRKNLWTGLASVTAFLLSFSILGLDCLSLYSGTVNDLLGIQTSRVVNEGNSTDDNIYFESEYGELNSENLQKLIADTYEQAVTEEEEGAVLLKNENNALPFAQDGMRVTLFGHAVVQPVYRAASAGSKGYEDEKNNIDLYTALTNSGIAVNDTLYQAYQQSKTYRGTGVYDNFSQTNNDWSIGEESIDFYTEDLQASWENDYNDAAIVMLAREGGEGRELYMEDPVEGISQLALHQEEKDLLEMVRDSGKFDRIIVLINSGWPMELGWLDEYGVDACLWIGCPGQRGFEAVANLLTGAANPSGRLQDTYAENSLSAPATINNGYHNQVWTNLAEVEAGTEDDLTDLQYYAVQAEGIYIGYKYYETRYEDTVLGQGNADSVVGSSDGGSWNYSDEVTFPFGYGLSYTEFETILNNVVMDGDNIQVTVTVTNTGNTAGKDVVQIYAQTPYGEYEKENLVEKSAIQLLNFGKTRLLGPGESETLTIDCDKYLLASYDYTNAKTYIMSEGKYYISVGENAHDALNNVLAAKGVDGLIDENGDPVSGNEQNTYSWTETFDDETYRTSQYTEAEITNQFDDCDINYWIDGVVTYLSRNDWEGTFPIEPVQIAATEEMMEILDGDYYVKSEDAPSASEFVQGERKGIPLAAMIGLEYDDPKWETYLDQFTVEEMASLLVDNNGTQGVEAGGVPEIKSGDGPDGTDKTFSSYGDDRQGCCYPSEIVLASTFNKDLMTRRGELMGEEYLYTGLTGGWMPGINLHRTPFGGRNFEYYSEDANVNYLCAIPVVEALQSRGIAAGPKHFTANDQELNRTGISTFFNEQAFREGALRGAEGAIAVADAHMFMHGFNRVGMKWCSASQALLSNVAKTEWGFLGKQITDAVGREYSYMLHFDTTLMAGSDCYCLDFAGNSSTIIVSRIEETDDGTLLERLREATHNSLYVAANSALMNGYSTDSVIEYITPWWQPCMYVLITVFAVLEILWLVLLIRGMKKKA